MPGANYVINVLKLQAACNCDFNADGIAFIKASTNSQIFSSDNSD